MDDNAKLFAKIASVMAKVRTLEKTGRNTYDKYEFVTADAVATRIGSALGEVSIAFFPSIINVETSEFQTQKGGTHFKTVVQMQITFACGETGATFTIPWFGEAIDRSDKSITKAVTSAVKYALIKTFLLAGGDEDEADAHSPAIETAPIHATGNGKAAQKPATAQKTPAAPDHPFEGEDATLDRLVALGVEVYGDEWKDKSKILADKASTGNTNDIGKLTQSERALLIGGMEKKLAAEKQPA